MSKWDLQQLLRRVCETDASDLILSVGTAPRIKLHGILQPFGAEELDAEGARQIVQSVLNPEQLRSLDAHRSIDLSRGYEGPKSSPKGRLNAGGRRETATGGRRGGREVAGLLGF